MGRVFDPLRRMGVQVLARAGDKLPATIKGPDALIPIDFRLTVPSAQVKSAVLFAALNAQGLTTIIERPQHAITPSGCSPPSAPRSRSKRTPMATA